MNTTVVVTDTATVSLSYRPALALNVSASAVSAYPGEAVEYQYEVINTGDVALTNVNVVDQRLGSVSLTATNLDPGASATGTLQYTVLAGDQPGTLVNTADASGESPLGSTVGEQKVVVVVVPAYEELFLPLVYK
jgi:hypothetical protein